jgi:glycosyltransferase involved in cell wall biosynthesis
LIEALSCGLIPVVTGIPSFRQLAGEEFGFYWPPGDVSGCAKAILEAAARKTECDRADIRAHFEQELSFSAIGRKALAAYGKLMDARKGRAE